MSVIIRFNGLCVLSVPDAAPAIAFFPLNALFPHKAILMTRTSSLAVGEQNWKPTGVGIDAEGEQVCYWEVQASDSPLILQADDQTPKDPKDSSQWDHKDDALLNLNKGTPVVSRKDGLKGCMLTLPPGTFKGSGKQEKFNLVNAKDETKIIQPGPFHGTVEWRSDHAKTSWRLVATSRHNNKPNNLVFKTDVAGKPVMLSISNIVPEFKKEHLPEHFDGVYEVVRDKNTPHQPPEEVKRCKLHPMDGHHSPETPIDVGILTEEGVNCIPPGGTS